MFATGDMFAASMSIDYTIGWMCDRVGEQLYLAPVVNTASATADQVTARIPFTGAYRLLNFTGNIAKKGLMERLQHLATYLDGPDSPISKYTLKHQVIDLITLFPSNCCQALQLASTLNPHNYKRVYVIEPSYHRGDGKAYETYGISKEAGAIVVVRPDQYVGLIVSLKDFTLLDEYFALFMLPAKDGGYPGSKVEKVSPPDWSKVENQKVSHTHAVVAENGVMAAGGKA
ncbi:uncharacterized protein JCM6883_001928 [Sporobolomyces salmoneus]|uniref:uncharacterized protein n=1 Tax=Sporobolomyces salmoneus TaxID=183962 RepID=UPI00317E6E91